MKGGGSGKLRHVGLFLFAFFLLIVSVPWFMAMPAAGLDPSWQMVLHDVYAQGLQFGRDVIFTFGPLGFLYVPQYYPEHYNAMLFFWSSIAVLFLSLIYFLSGSINKIQCVIQAVLFYTVLTVSVYIKNDVIIFSYFALLLLFVLDKNVEAGGWKTNVVIFVLVFFSALMGLIKYPGFMLGAVIFILLDSRLLLLKKAPVYTLLFFALLVLLAVTVGKQNVENILPYLYNGWFVASGFSQGMQLSKSFPELLIYLSTVLSFIVFTACIEWKEKRFDVTGITRWLGLLLILFMSFKAGHVRQDGAHIQISWGTLVFVMALYSVYFFKGFPQRSYQVLFCMIAVLAVAPTIYIHTTKAKLAYWDVLDRDVWQRLRAASELLLYGKQQQNIAYAAAIKGIKNKFPLQERIGSNESVDIYPWQASVLIANYLNYTPRPLLQSYQAYTGKLAAFDREFLYSNRAPARLVFGVGSIDGRYPGMDDGYSWVDILSLYDMGEQVGDYLILKRRVKPRVLSFENLASQPFLLNESISLPWVDGHDGYLMARLDLRKTALGMLINTLYKMPEMYMTLIRRDGSKLQYRLIPEVLSKGMIISPIVNYLPAWQQMLPEHRGQQMHEDYIPVSITFSGGKWFCDVYNCKTMIELKRFTISKSVEK